jgi:chemotaxis response regulator CheB
MALATDIQPDVALMHFQMPRLDCAAAALAIGSRLPEVRVAMISGADSAGEEAEKLEIALLPKASVTAETLEQLLGDAA